jgi:hypothetical protein
MLFASVAWQLPESDARDDQSLRTHPEQALAHFGVQTQMPVMLHRSHERWQNGFQPFSADSVCRFPDNRERRDHGLVINAPAPRSRHISISARPSQYANCILAVVSRNLGKLVENLLFLNPSCRPVSLSYCFYQFASRLHAESPPH